MKYLLFVLLVAAGGLEASAQNNVIDLSELTAEQQAEFKLAVEKAKKHNTYQLMDREAISEWATWGSGVGVAMSSAAKEIGVAVEDFAGTTVGKVTIAIIIYKVIGNELIHVTVGVFFFIVTFTAWVRYFRRMCLFDTEEYNEKGKLVRRTYKPASQLKDEDHGTRIMMFVVLIFIVAVTMVTIFTG